MILTFLASFTVFICFDFCTSDLRSSCCLRTSWLYDVFVFRSVDTLLVSVWSLHTMTSLSWLAKRAAIVSVRSNAPKLDAETKQVISRFGLSRRRGSRAGKHKHCDRPKFSSRASATERKSMTSSVGFPSSSATGQRATWSQVSSNRVATLPCNFSSIACFLTLMFYNAVWQHMQRVVGFLITT